MIKFDEWAILTNDILNGFQVIKLIQGEFKDIGFVYESVAVQENEEKTEAKISFTYSIISGFVPDDKLNEFKQFTGDLLSAILQEQLEKGDVVYSGGV